jgi:DNA-binding CsgD family transcriptional regulator
MLVQADHQRMPLGHILIMASNQNRYQKPYLTQRQKTCLSLVAEGKTARGIALELGISVRMVRWHLQCARSRLGAVSSAQAVYLANKAGLME